MPNSLIISLLLIMFTVIALFWTWYFTTLPRDKQAENVKQWLIYAVSIAESKLGSGTGKLKLREVYNMFLDKFPKVAAWVSFDVFSDWVDWALIEMDKILKNGGAIADLINNSKL